MSEVLKRNGLAEFIRRIVLIVFVILGADQAACAENIESIYKNVQRKVNSFEGKDDKTVRYNGAFYDFYQTNGESGCAKYYQVKQSDGVDGIRITESKATGFPEMFNFGIDKKGTHIVQSFSGYSTNLTRQMIYNALECIDGGNQISLSEIKSRNTKAFIKGRWQDEGEVNQTNQMIHSE
jgi:hypothetical protein